MGQQRRKDARAESEEEDFECDPELADSLELDAYDRGEEAALGLIRLTARLAEVDPLDVDSLSDGQFHHELAHALSGFLEGMLISLRQETNIDRGNVNTGLLRVVDALGLEEAEDDDDSAVVTEIEDESLASFVEMARVSGVPDAADVTHELVGTLERSIEGMIDETMKRSGREGAPPHVAKGVLMVEVMRELAARLMVVPDVGFGLLRFTLASIDEATTQEQEGAKIAAVTEGPAAIRRAQMRSRTADTETATAPTAGKIPGGRKSRSGAKPRVAKRTGKTRK